jgi:putative transposase
MSASDLCRKHGIREPQAEEAAGGDDAGRVDAEGDARKKLLTPSLRRRAVTWAVNEKGYSQRRACRLVGLQAKTYRYASTRPDDGALWARLKELASQRRRFGYRRLGLLLARQGIRVNRKKLYRR